MTTLEGLGGLLARAHRTGALYPVSIFGAYVVLAIAVALPWSLSFRFGFPEIAVLASAPVLLSALVSPRGVTRGLAAAALGVLFGTVGINAITGDVRFVFQQPVLWEGLPLTIVLSGLFVIPWALSLLRPVPGSPYSVQVFSIGAGSIIVPMALLTGVVNWGTWLALPVIGVFTSIGLIMKRYAWPRFPLLVGVVFGPTIEKNFLGALNVVEPITIGSVESAILAVLLRPWNLALAVLVLAFATLSYQLARDREGHPPDADPYVRGTILLVLVTASLSLVFLGWLAFTFAIALLVLATRLADVGEQSGGFVRRVLSRLELPSAQEVALPLALGIAVSLVLTAVAGIQWGIAALGAMLPFLLVRSTQTRPATAVVGMAFAGTALLLVVKLSTGTLAAGIALGVESIGLLPLLNLPGFILGLPAFVMYRLADILLTWRLIWPVDPDGSGVSLSLFLVHMTGIAILSLSLVLANVRPAGSTPESPVLRMLVSWQMLASLVMAVLTLEAVHTIVL